MIDYIRHALASQMVSGGLLLLLSGAALALMRSIPGRCIHWLKRWSIVEIEIRHRALIEMVANFVAEGRRRNLRLGKASIEWRSEGVAPPASVLEGSSGDDREYLQIEAGYGTHFVRFNGVPILMERSFRADDAKNSGSTDFMLPMDTLKLRTIGRSVHRLEPFLEAAREHARSKVKKRPELYLSQGYSAEWHKLSGFTWRSMNSVCLPEGMAEDLLREIKDFLAAQQRYADLGIPWRLGYLLEGPPGTGKSTLARALAGEFTLPVYAPILRDKGLSDAMLARLLGNVPSRSIVLLEDIDCVTPARQGEQSDSLTLSGLLNCVDGPMAMEGRILLMTTNAPETLDPALLRPGRVDRRIHLGPATAGQAESIYLRFHPDAEASARAFGREMAGQTMAEIQGKLLHDGGGSPLRLIREGAGS